jgi:AcrR family transcriptional regulator
MGMPASLVAAHPELDRLLKPAGSSQRARLLEGMTQAVYRKGYAAATVADAVREARVSRGTFYDQFASKEECFLEAYRHGVDVLLARVAAAAREAPGGWEARLRAGMRAYLEALAGEPRFARTYLLEIQAAGPRAQAARDAALRQFAARYGSSFAAAREERPELAEVDRELLFGLAAGVSELICARLRDGTPDQLPALEDTLVRFARTLLEGASVLHDQGAPRWT